MKNYLKNYFKKGNNTLEKFILSIIISFVIATIYTIVQPIFIIDRIILVTLALMFIFLHGIIKLEKIYLFIYKFRYHISLVILILYTLCEYSGSSIGAYSSYVQPRSGGEYFMPVLGEYRYIRGDEWTVNTPIFVSQGIDKDTPYAYYNDNLRGTMTDMFCVVSPAVNDILCIAKPFNLSFLILGIAKGISILWIGKWLALILVSFEFFMMLTERKKLLSLLGMILVVFSAATQWWNMTDLITWGLLALLAVDKYLRTDSIRMKLLCGFGIFISAISFAFMMYPAWQIPFLFIYIVIFISMWFKNKDMYKLHKIDFFIIFVVLLGIVAIILRYIHMSYDALYVTMNTAYPGERFEIGGGGVDVLFSYVYSFLFPYISIANPCEWSGMLSFYPIPMILAAIYLIVNVNKDRRKHIVFLLPLLALSVIFSIFSLFETNEVLAKLTLLYMVPGKRLAVPLGFIQIIILIYLLSISNNDTKLLKTNITKGLTAFASIVILFIAIKSSPVGVLNITMMYFCGIVLVIFLYLLLTYNKNKNFLIYGLIAMALVTGLTVNPLQRGISVLTDKPIAKEVQKIIKSDPENNLWIAESVNYHVPNYILANGARIINSTNIYPNFDLYKTILSTEDYNNSETVKIFNRYSHMYMKITASKNEVFRIGEDTVVVSLTPNKVKELGVKYIVTTRNLDEFDTDSVDFEKIYNELELSIYKVN